MRAYPLELAAHGVDVFDPIPVRTLRGRSKPTRREVADRCFLGCQRLAHPAFASFYFAFGGTLLGVDTVAQPLEMRSENLVGADEPFIDPFLQLLVDIQFRGHAL